jgi:hypothetical protein
MYICVKRSTEKSPKSSSQSRKILSAAFEVLLYAAFDFQPAGSETIASDSLSKAFRE